VSKGPWKKKEETDGVSPTLDKPPKVSHKGKFKKITLDMVDGLVQLVNLPIGFVVPAYALTETESAALTVAIADLAMQNVWVNNLIYNLVTANTMAELPIVVGAITVNKLVIAGKVPEMVGLATGGILESVAARRGKGKANVEPGTTRRPDRADGIGQDDASTGAPETAGLYPLPDNQAGHGTVAGAVGESLPS
jgi:hypothetical protein